MTTITAEEILKNLVATEARVDQRRDQYAYSELGMQTVFWLNGPLEMLDDQDRIVEAIDVFWFIGHYESYCDRTGTPINRALYLLERPSSRRRRSESDTSPPAPLAIRGLFQLRS